jgi:hypothetical protein
MEWRNGTHNSEKMEPTTYNNPVVDIQGVAQYTTKQFLFTGQVFPPCQTPRPPFQAAPSYTLNFTGSYNYSLYFPFHSPSIALYTFDTKVFLLFFISICDRFSRRVSYLVKLKIVSTKEGSIMLMNTVVQLLQLYRRYV